MPAYGVFQNDIYIDVLRGVVPTLPVDFATIEARAHAMRRYDLATSPNIAREKSPIFQTQIARNEPLAPTYQIFSKEVSVDHGYRLSYGPLSQNRFNAFIDLSDRRKPHQVCFRRK